MVSAGSPDATLPRSVSASKSVETRDTPENRFIKYALVDFVNVLIDMERRLQGSTSQSDRRVLREVLHLRESIAGYLNSSLFREVGSASFLPLGSPVLQRCNGYREVLDAWVRFNLAAKLSWAGGEDVFGGGKKDVAVLYEYWIFYILLDIVSQELEMETPTAASLFGYSAGGFDVRLKAGTLSNTTRELLERSTDHTSAIQLQSHLRGKAGKRRAYLSSGWLVDSFNET